MNELETKVENSKEQTEISEVVLPQTVKPDDYSTIEIKKGQYWIRGIDLIAFVLECNEYGVIYQVKIDKGPNDTVVFDFEAGQELMSPDRFRKLLNDTNARMYQVEPKMAELALIMFENKLQDGLVYQPKVLPRDPESSADLIEYEHYTVERNIVPPLIRDRKKKAFHWLKAGASDTMVPKLWDPDLDNWTLPNGDIDLSARLGFVKGYGHLAVAYPNQADEETLERQVDRTVDFLKSENFFFDAKWLKELLLSFGVVAFTESDELITEPSATVPAYDFIKHVDEDGLVVYYVLGKTVKARLVFPEIQNNEFIGKNGVCRVM